MSGRLLRSVLMLALMTIVSGCAMFQRPADSIRFDRGAFLVAYAEGKAGMTLLAYQIRQVCAEQARVRGPQSEQFWRNPDALKREALFDAEKCANAMSVIEQAKTIDTSIQKAIMNPSTETDWAAIAEMIKLIVSLAAKAL